MLRQYSFADGSMNQCLVVKSKPSYINTRWRISQTQKNFIMFIIVLGKHGCCATNRKVAGSIPAGVTGYFIGIKSFRSHYGPWGDSAPNRNEYQEYFLGGKGDRCLRLTTLPPPCAVVKKSGNLNFLEPSGPLQACDGTALPFYQYIYIYIYAQKLLACVSTTHWFLPVARCMTCGSVELATSDSESRGTTRHTNHSTDPVFMTGGNIRKIPSTCTALTVTPQHTQNCTQFQTHCM